MTSLVTQAVFRAKLDDSLVSLTYRLGGYA